MADRSRDLTQVMPSAIMLSLLLGCAFVSRQFWGWLSDRIGGLRIVLCGSRCQLVTMLGFPAGARRGRVVRPRDLLRPGLQRNDPVVRELFPAADAAWRVPTLLLFSG